MDEDQQIAGELELTLKKVVVHSATYPWLQTLDIEQGSIRLGHANKHGSFSLKRYGINPSGNIYEGHIKHLLYSGKSPLFFAENEIEVRIGFEYYCKMGKPKTIKLGLNLTPQNQQKQPLNKS